MHWHGNVNHHVVKHTHSVFLSYNLNCLNSIRCASTSAETFNSLSASSSSSTVEFPFPEHLRPTPYEIFHLRPGASPNAIKSRCTVDALMYCVFRCFWYATGILDYQLVRIHHPDAPYARTLPTDISHARFQAIQAAYDVLTGKMRRRDFPSPMYDASPMVHKTNRSYDHMHHRSHFTHAEWAHSSFESGAASKEDDNSRVFALIMTGVRRCFTRLITNFTHINLCMVFCFFF